MKTKELKKKIAKILKKREQKKLEILSGNF